MDYKIFIGALGVVITVVSYFAYFKDMFAGRTKPHAFSWLVWTVLEGIAFAAQISQHGGAGAWITGVTSIICGVVFVYALFNGNRTFPIFDWIALIVAFIAILLWWWTKNPTLSVILVVITDAAGFVPTFRKAYHKPFEETVSMYALSAVKYPFSLAALQSYSIATWFYPASLMLTNALFVIMVTIRRRQLKQKTLA